MSADIQKESVFDDRIIQHRPKYAVEKGALSLTNAPFNAIAATQSQMSFNIYVPSENVFVDRAIRWSGTALFQMNITCGPGKPAGTPVAVNQGGEYAVSPFPLNGLCQTMTATINDTTTVINSQDVLFEVMRLTNYKKNLLQRTCPTQMDKYQANYLGNLQINSPMNGFGEAMNDDEVPNGAWPGFQWTNSDGSPVLGGDGSQQYAGQPDLTIAQGQVLWAASATPGAQGLVYFSITSTELLTLSPFVFANDQESDTGLFGINNIQLIMNFKPNVSRVLKYLGYNSGSYSVLTPGSLTWNTQATSVWRNPVLNVQFLTPSLDVPLPPKSVVPYFEFPRYISNSYGSVPAYNNQTFGATPPLVQIVSQTITLPQIPDLLIVYVKAGRDGAGPDPQDNTYGDAYMPLASPYNGQSTTKPLSVNFDNFSGLLSSHTTEELYQMSVANGLEMNFPQWSGQAKINAPTSLTGLGPTAAARPFYFPGAPRPTTGGFLVLKPSKDLTLQPGQAPSLVGNFTLQFNISVVNTYPFSVVPTLYVITANSGFFESIRGSSRIIKGVLSEQDIISAPMSASQTHEGLRRLVGGGWGSTFANFIRKARDLYHATKPAISAIKPHLGENMGEALGALGYGGARASKKGLSSRLM